MPVAEVSWTKPGIFLFEELLTGISSLPSRIVIAASSPAIPLACASRRMFAATFEIALSLVLMVFLIRNNSSEAVSLKSPNLSRMVSIFLWISGKQTTFELILLRLGYTPSLVAAKKSVSRRTVSARVLSLPRDTWSMVHPSLARGLRKSMQSM